MRSWVFAVLACCSGPPDKPPIVQPRPVGPDVVPTLEVTAPARGAFIERGKLVVQGRATDDGAVKVTVNGVAATVRDGAFTATLDAPSGVLVLETHAIDTTGHDVRDVRAALVGPFARSDGSARAAIGAYLGSGTVGALGNALAGSAKALDLNAAAKAINPVYSTGNCLGARVDIADLATGKISVGLIPKQTVIATAVTIEDVVVHLDVHYKVACVGGTTTMTVKIAKAVVLGSLAATIERAAVRTAMPNPVIELEGFDLDIGGLPKPIEFILRKASRPAVELALTKAIESKLPPLADAKLAELFANAPVPLLLGRPLTIDVAPRKIEITPSGVALAADTALVVTGGEGGRYASAPSGKPEVKADGMWVAADTVNQLLAGLWAARAFEQTFQRSAVGPMAMLLDSRVATIQVSLALPPTVRADGTLELAVGDLTLTTRDAGDAELQRFAVSVTSALTTKPGGLALTTGEPAVFAQVLAQDPALGRPLDGPAVEGLVKGAWSLVAGMIDDALSHVPIPGLAGASLEIRSVTARAGTISIAVGIKSN